MTRDLRALMSADLSVSAVLHTSTEQSRLGRSTIEHAVLPDAEPAGELLDPEEEEPKELEAQ